MVKDWFRALGFSGLGIIYIHIYIYGFVQGTFRTYQHHGNEQIRMVKDCFRHEVAAGEVRRSKP